MAGTSAIDSALKRLSTALDMVEGAVEHRFEHESTVAGLESEVHRLGTDRSRLAQSLDAAAARSEKLEETNREVSRRLVAAMESIRAVLDRNGS
jgi:hypothetical protein